MDLISGKYDIKDIKATNTISYLKVNKKGEDNYSIWKEDTSSTSKQFSFNLEKVRFKKLSLSYKNQIQKQNISISTEQLRLTGKFSDVSYRLKTKGEIFVKEFTNDDVGYLSNKNTNIDLDLLINTKEQSYSIKKGELSIEDLNFSISGKYISSEKKNSTLDLTVKGNNISFISVFSIFPETFLTSLKKYDSKGLLNFEATLIGEVGKSIVPKIEAKFSLEQGELTEKETNIALTNLSFDGSFSNQNEAINSLLILKNIKGQLSNNGGSFSGSLTLKDFANMQIESNIQSTLNLGVVNLFIPSPVIKSLTGTAILDYSLKGNYLNNEFNLISSNGKVNFSEVNITTTENKLVYENLSGLGTLNQNDISFHNFEGTVANSTFNGNTTIKNLIPYLLDQKNKVWIDANISSKKFDLTTLIQQMKTDGTSTKNENADTIRLPEQFQVNLTATLNELTYNNFTAKHITGTIRLKNQHLTTENITFKTSGGHVLFNSEIEQTPTNEFLWTGNTKLDNINIQDFFTSVDNFSQDFVTDKNLKGKGSLLLDFGMLFSTNFTLIKPSITINAETKISNGMLINHATMNELAVYLDENKIVNKIIDTERLKKKVDKIKFSELKSTILIKNSIITIPKTSIESSLLDINIAGTHSFDNNVDYHFSFGLRDVLIKNKQIDDLGPVKDDGLGKIIFLHIFGNLNDLKYEIDKTEKKANKKEERAEEKQNVKSILKEEFGLFKKDSSLKSNSKKTVEPTFEIEDWEENDNQEEKDTEKVKKEKKTPKWLKKLGVDKKEEPQQKIAVDFNENDL